jgi:AcrR family transcriptional regulator
LRQVSGTGAEAGVAQQREAAAAAPKKRQARGERRIAEILTAAGQVFAESGYSATTTNAIAARAGVSPGTLYQYFPNKEAIADALAERYGAQLDELQNLLAVPDPASVSLTDLVGRALDPMLAFHVENPACTVLFAGPDVPQWLADLHAPLHASMLARVEAFIALLAPGLPADDLRRSAEVTVGAFKGLLLPLMAADEQERPAVQAEIGRLFIGYFTSLTGRR